MIVLHLPFYVSHYVHFDCIELMREAFEHRCMNRVGFSCKDSSSNYVDADVVTVDVVALNKSFVREGAKVILMMIHQTLDANNLPSTNNCVQQHVGNWVEVVDGADSYEAAHDYD